MNQFTKYLKVANKLVGRQADEFWASELYVMPKLDGTSASVWLDADGQLCAGSRNRQLEAGDDNAGFYAYVQSRADFFTSVLERLAGATLYGEWLVRHSYTDYEEDAWRKFYVFDVVLATGEHMNPLAVNEACKLLGLDYVPVLYTLTEGEAQYSEVKRALEEAPLGWLCAKGVGEGVVVKCPTLTDEKGRPVCYKVLSDSFDCGTVKPKNHGRAKVEAPEVTFVNANLTGGLVAKECAKVRVALGLEKLGRDNTVACVDALFEGFCEDVDVPAELSLTKVRNALFKPVVAFMAAQ